MSRIACVVLAPVRSACLSLVLAGCAAAPSPSGAPREESVAPDAPVSTAQRLDPPPPGCRPLRARATPPPRFVEPIGSRQGIETAIHTAADRVVVFQHPSSEPVRGEMFDPATDAWIPTATEGAPRFGTFDDGPGPLGAPQWVAFEDWIVVTWFDGNHHTRFSGAVFDARRNAWSAMSTDGMPDRLADATTLGARGVLVRLGSDLDGGFRYDVRRDRWAPIATEGAPTARHAAAVVVAGGRILVWGGVHTGTLTDGAIYDVASDRWTAMASGPSARIAPFAAATETGMVVWSGLAATGEPPTVRDGGFYDLGSDRWRAIGAENAPDPTIGGIFEQDLAWTGEALLYRELPDANRASPRRLAFHDPSVGRWWRASALSHARPLLLGFGRVLLLEPSGPRVIHPRQELECPITLPDLPLFASLDESTRFAAVSRIGDELVLWGRIDTHEAGGACPPGAPCRLAQAAMSALPIGAVISP